MFYARFLCSPRLSCLFPPPCMRRANAPLLQCSSLLLLSLCSEAVRTRRQRDGGDSFTSCQLKHRHPSYNAGGFRFRREAIHTVRFIERTLLQLQKLTSSVQTQDSSYSVILSSVIFPCSEFSLWQHFES